jgi:predicted metal-dependent peptidase
MHELGHICFQHMFMSDSFADSKYFNVAADAEVNSYIENLPKDGITPKWLSQKLGKQLDKGLGTKKYYEAIQDYLNQQQQQAQNPQQPCNGGKGGSSQQSQSQSQSQPDSQPDSQQSPQSSSPSDATQDETQQDQESQQPENQQRQQQRANEDEESQYPNDFEQELQQFDDHSTWKDFKDIPEATQQLMQNNINSILKATAEEVEKMRGTIPGEFKELIEKLREKKPEVFNWKTYFRRLLGSIYDVNIRSTRRKPSKRFEGNAGIQHKKKVSILVAVDTSGSVSQKELQEFFSEIDYVYKAGARVTILQCDTRINSIEEYDGKNLPTIKGRGGTDFNPPVNYYYKHRKDYATLIYFTDGEAPLPAKNPSGMVWVISSMGYHQDFPGKTIYIPKENI